MKFLPVRRITIVNNLSAIITHMDRPPPRGFYLQVLLLGVVAALLVVAPLPQTVTQAMRAARLALETGAYPAAFHSLSQVASFFPSRTDIRLLAGEAAYQAGDPQSAIQFLSPPTSSQTLPPSSLLTLGDAYLAAGNYRQAIQVWQTIPAQAGFTDGILLRLLDLHRSQADYPAVVEDLKALLRLHPGQAGYLYQLGLLLAALDPEASLAYLSQAGEIDPSLAENSSQLIRQINTARLYDETAYTQVSVGRWLASIEEWQLAQLAFQQAVQQRPDYAEAWAYLGETLQHTSMSDKTAGSSPGLAELQKALQINPDSVTANLLMSMYWQRQADKKAALDSLEKAAQLEPDNPIIQAELGRVTASLGDLAVAQDYYEQAAALAPTNPTFWRLLAEFSLDHQAQVRQIALPAARNAVMLAPQDPLSNDLMGRTLLALGDWLNAQRYLRTAITLDPSNPSAHLHLGLAYLNQGDNFLARQEFATAESLAPDSSITDQIDRLNSYFFP
jgi:tetratricopeptide (TPR) repeat protein